MSEKLKQLLYEYTNTIANSKSKLDYEDCFVLGLIMAKFNKSSNFLNEVSFFAPNKSDLMS